MKPGSHWDEYEIMMLTHTWGKYNREDMQKFFPGRSWKAIREKANKLGLAYNPKHEPRLPKEVRDSMSRQEKALRWYYSHRKNSAKSRKIEWELTQEEFNAIVTQDCHYCGAQTTYLRSSRYSKVVKVSGMDRKNNGSYTKNEVVPCCADCNTKKGTTPYNEFVERNKR